MSINKTIKVDDARGQILADERNRSVGKDEKEDIPSIKEGHQSTDLDVNVEELGDYEGRKHDSEIEGGQQDSQETDEIYADTRLSAGLPPAGKNVGDLNAFDLAREDK